MALSRYVQVSKKSGGADGSTNMSFPTSLARIHFGKRSLQKLTEGKGRLDVMEKTIVVVSQEQCSI